MTALPIEKVDYAGFQRIIDINVWGVIYGTKESSSRHRFRRRARRQRLQPQRDHGPGRSARTAPPSSRCAASSETLRIEMLSAGDPVAVTVVIREGQDQHRGGPTAEPRRGVPARPAASLRSTARSSWPCRRPTPRRSSSRASSAARAASHRAGHDDRPGLFDPGRSPTRAWWPAGRRRCSETPPRDGLPRPRRRSPAPAPESAAAIALELADMGAPSSALTDMDDAGLAATAAGATSLGAEAHSEQFDVTDKAAWAAYAGTVRAECSAHWTRS